LTATVAADPVSLDRNRAGLRPAVSRRGIHASR
jgi:hypothetical protein